MRITPIDWHILACVFEQAGFKRDRIKGSHLSMTKPGAIRPVIIPMYDEVGMDVIHSNMRTAGINREHYFEFLKKCKN